MQKSLLNRWHSCGGSQGTARGGKTLTPSALLHLEEGTGIWMLVGWTAESVQTCDEEADVLKSFSYLGNVVHSSIVKKSERGLAWPTLLCARPTRALGVVGVCGEEQRSESSSNHCSLFNYTVIRHGHWFGEAIKCFCCYVPSQNHRISLEWLLQTNDYSVRLIWDLLSASACGTPSRGDPFHHAVSKIDNHEWWKSLLLPQSSWLDLVVGPVGRYTEWGVLLKDLLGKISGTDVERWAGQYAPL